MRRRDGRPARAAVRPRATRRRVPSPKSATPSASSPARSVWPAATLRSCSSSQPAWRSTHASISNRCRPIASTVNAPAIAVVAERDERLLAPAPARPPVADDRAERLVPVADDRRGHLDGVADARFRGPAPAIDGRCHVGDRDSLGSHPRDTVNSPPCCRGDQSASSSIPPRCRAAGWGRRRSPSSTGWRPRGRAGGRSCPSTRPTSSARRMRPRRRSRRGAGCSPTRRRGSSRASCGRSGHGRDAGATTGRPSPAATPSRSRCGSSANGSRFAATRPDAASASSATCRSTSRPTAATIGLTPSSSSPSTSSSRARRRTTSTTSASCGATRSTTGRRWPPTTTGGGSSGCAACSTSSTSSGSTTSAASPGTGRFPRARRPRGKAGGRRGRAGRSSVPPRRRSGRCR